jgi:flagellar hook-associated protein 2
MTTSPVGYSPPVSFTGLESGLNTQQIISAYLQIDEAPLVDLENQQSAVNTKISAYQSLQTQLQALEQAGNQLSAPNAFASAVKASSTNSSVATATTTTGARPGSTTFSVVQLASADTLVSSGTVASTSDVVASGDLLVAAGGSGLGITSLSGNGLSTGAHTVAVTQSSAAAQVTGAVLGPSTTISSGADQLDVTLDGVAQTYTLADGTYTASQLAAEIGTASGGALTGSINAQGQLVLASAQQGSQASLQIGSGSANAVLGLSPGASSTGTDGVITVDGTANTVSSIAADGSTVVTLQSGSGGTITAQLSAPGLVEGSLTAQNVSTGNGSLASVVSAINQAGAGVTANAVQVGANAYALELSSSASGAANDVSVATSSFSGSPLGTLETSTAGQDAVVALGGAGGFQLHSASNTFTSLLPGVSVQLQSTSASPVTVTVAADGSAAASMVQNFVDATDTVLATIATDTAYNEQTNTAGPLNGQFGLENLREQILSTVGQVIGRSSAVDSATAGSAAGLSLGTGTINFDATTFAADFAADPAAVAGMFTQAGSFSPGSGSPAAPGDVSLVYAANGTQPGSYAVSISHSATQATDNGSTVLSAGQTVAQSATYSISSGGATASYGVQAGQSLAEVASGLDAALAAAGLALSAQVVAAPGGSSLQITSAGYGSSASFQVSGSGADPLGIVSASPFGGSDVAGTINGVAATGSGQVLSAPVSDPTLAGLALQVQTAGISSPVQIGTYGYSPGIAQALASLAAAAVAPDSGQIATAISSLQATSTTIGSQISIEQQLVVQQQQALTQEYTNLESTLASLKSESSFLTQTFGSNSASSLVNQLASSGSGSSSSSSGG